MSWNLLPLLSDFVFSLFLSLPLTFSLFLSLSSALIFLFVSFIFRAHSKLSRYAESRINWYARATFFSLSRRERSGRSDTSICNMLPMSYSRDFSRDSILYFLYLHARSYTSCISREIIFLRWTRVWKKRKVKNLHAKLIRFSLERRCGESARFVFEMYLTQNALVVLSPLLLFYLFSLSFFLNAISLE